MKIHFFPTSLVGVVVAVGGLLLTPHVLTGQSVSNRMTPGATDRDQWHLEYTPKPRVTFTMFQNRYAPDGDVSEYVAFAAVPPELPHQRQVRSSVAVNGTQFPSATVKDMSSYHRPLFMARVPARTRADRTNITLSVTHEVSLFVRRLVRGPNTNPPPVLTASERALALADGPSFGFASPEFVAWLKETGLHRRPDETAIAFGRRAWLFVGEHMNYITPYPGWNDQLSKACRSLTGDCGAYARLFVGIMRANTIPARCLVGFYVKPGEGRRDGDNHVKSEFFAEGVGWVPADSTWKKPEYFGLEAGDFITLHLYAEEPIAMLTPHWGVQKRGCLMVIETRCVARRAGHPQWKSWHVTTRVK